MAPVSTVTLAVLGVAGVEAAVGLVVVRDALPSAYGVFSSGLSYGAGQRLDMTASELVATR